MSTHWGFICRSHDPELKSECWFNHGDEFLLQVFAMVRAGQWPENEWGEPEPTRFGGHGEVVGPIYWLREHPRCDVALRNEYGVLKDIPGPLLPEPMMPVEPPRAMLYPPVPPEGWKLIAPADAVPGDGTYRVGHGIYKLGPMMFGPIPIEIRRVSWAVRRIE